LKILFLVRKRFYKIGRSQEMDNKKFSFPCSDKLQIEEFVWKHKNKRMSKKLTMPHPALQPASPREHH